MSPLILKESVRENFRKALEECDSDLIHTTVQNVFEYFQKNPNNYLQALDAASNILYISIFSLQDGESVVAGFFTEDPDGYCSLYRQKTVDDVLQWLRFLTGKMCEMLDRKRSDCKNIKVAIVRKYINEHVTERLSLNEVAEIFDISPNYLSQLFRKYNHTGFIEYVNTCKIEEAKRLLEREHLLVYETADALGYESAFYFSKVFKKIEGISPTEYVNSNIHKLCNAL